MELVDSKPAVVLAGHLDGRCSAQVRAAVYDHIEKHPDTDLVLDLSRVESLDVTMLRMLSACALRLERDGRRVVLRGCSPALSRVFAFGAWRRLFRFERQPVG